MRAVVAYIVEGYLCPARNQRTNRQIVLHRIRFPGMELRKKLVNELRVSAEKF